MIQNDAKGVHILKKEPDSPFASREIQSNDGDDKGPEMILVGEDRELLQLREQLFATRNVAITSVNCEEAALEARSDEARVWVFCSTIDPSELVHLASSVRRYSPESKLLFLEGLTPIGDREILFHDVMHSTDGVDELMSAVSALSMHLRHRRKR